MHYLALACDNDGTLTSRGRLAKTTEVNVEITRDGRAQTVTYKPGAPGAMSAGGAAGVLPSVWYWDGPKLVTEALRNVSDTTVRHKAIYSLDAGGSELTVESLLQLECAEMGNDNSFAGGEYVSSVR